MRGAVRSAGSLVLSAMAGACLLSPSPSLAFSILEPYVQRVGDQVDVLATLAGAPRWSAAPGARWSLSDGISVGIERGIEEEFGFTAPDEVGAFREMILRGFEAWETAAISFDVRFDVLSSAVFEISVTATDSVQGAFAPGLVGRATTVPFFDTARMLTNGDLLPGQSIRFSAIDLASDRILAFAEAFTTVGLMTEDETLDRIQDVLVHEIGHALGLGHPNLSDGANFDDDGDPLTAIAVDPSNPFAGITVSDVVDRNAIMDSNISWFTEALQPDDISGIRVLYPVPEPSLPVMSWLGAVGFIGAARRRRAHNAIS